jgi:HAD superfamily hydrolase (TIGR01509 family)
MPRFSLIVFDMDGVLVDSTGFHAQAYQELWARLGIPDPPPYSEIAGVRTDEAVRTYTASLHPSESQIAEWVKFKQGRARELLQGLAAFPGVVDALEQVSRRGIHLALGTGASRTTTTLLLGQAGLLRFFPVIVTADDVTQGKPDPATYTRAIELSQGDPAGSLVVEVSHAGLVAGAAAGAATASVRTGERIDDGRFLGTFPDVAALVAKLIESPA